MAPPRLPKFRPRRVRLRRPRRIRRPRLPRIPFRQSLTKLPNLLTYGRILSIPAVVWLLHQSHVRPPAEQPFWAFAAALGFTLAALTDWFDGWLARTRNLQTLLGRFLDPVADKLLVMALLVQLVGIGRIPAWIVIALIAREMFINGLRSIAAGEGFEVPVVSMGKWKTTAQFIALVALLLYDPAFVPILEITLPAHAIGTVALWTALFLSITSAVLYVRVFVKAVLRRESIEG